MYVHTHARTHNRTIIDIHTYMCIYIHIDIHTYIYIYVYIYIYNHTRTHKRSIIDHYAAWVEVQWQPNNMTAQDQIGNFIFFVFANRFFFMYT